MPTSSLLFAYLAGVLDSDGYFGIHRNTLRVRQGDMINARFDERIVLTQVDAIVPELMKETFGGSVRHIVRSGPNCQPLYTWIVTNVGAGNAARAVLPYLRIKPRQAQIIIALSEHKSLPRSVTRVKKDRLMIRRFGKDKRSQSLVGTVMTISPESLRFREGLFLELRALHQHGADPLRYPAQAPKLI